MSLPITAQILTQATLTMLVQVLLEEPAARVTGLDVAPLAADSFGNQREQVRIAWQGENSTGQYHFVLYALPEVTWSEQVNPSIPAPSPILFAESDLPDVLTMLVEGFVAVGARRGTRPAWVLRHDWTATPTLAQREDALPLVLAQTAAFHALHWDAETVLRDVYPWLPEFNAWVAERSTMTPLTTLIAALPQTLIHGTWQAAHLRLHNDKLWVEGWDRLMVGPAVWDVYLLLASLDVEDYEAAGRQYCALLQETVTEFSEADTESFIAALRLLWEMGLE
jgi:hypothetical protein